jgi:rubrerythrin
MLTSKVLLRARARPIAKLFKAVAHAEMIHASNHFNNIRDKGDAVTVSVAGFGSKTTSEDLQVGIDGETFEVEEMYPSYLEVTHTKKEYTAEVSFRYAWEAEKTHAELYERAKDIVDAGSDIDLGPIGVCKVCGYTIEGEAPDNCPICKAKKDTFSFYSV